MPMFKALKLCPDAVVIRPNMEKYAEVGAQIRAMMLDLTPLVEPLSIDEAFMDLTGTERLHHATPAESLARLTRCIEREIGITVSIGLAFNKFLAKLASDLDKPRGFAVIGRAEAIDFLADKPVGLIWGVGKTLGARLAADGIHRIATLQTMDEAVLGRRYGAIGLRLARLARADDTRAVEPREAAKSISAETTFDADIAAVDELRAILRSLAEKVARRLKRAGLAGANVTLKLKTNRFRTLTRSRHLTNPTQSADRIFDTGAEMLAREADGTRFRLIGLGVADLTDPGRADPQDLLNAGGGRRAAAEAAIESIREKYGNRAVEMGLVYASRATRRPPNEGTV
jgi:DNA polymerase-4